jgi:hypothetical protein
VKYLSDDHKSAIIENCSKYKDCILPNFDQSPTKNGCEIINHPSANTITPLPFSGTYEQQQDDGNGGHRNVTPNIDDVLAVGKKKSATELKPPSKAQLEIHRKWQAAAEVAGGVSARIVLSKPAAKSLIFSYLFNEFFPKNITDIHKVRHDTLRFIGTENSFNLTFLLFCFCRGSKL